MAEKPRAAPLGPEAGTAGEAPTADRLRVDIDRGRAGDKQDFPDPAAAPLGTDDEAAGTSPTEVQRRAAHRQEVEGRPPDTTPSPEGHVPDLDPARRGGGRGLAFVVVAVVLLAVLVIALVLGA